MPLQAGRARFGGLQLLGSAGRRAHSRDCGAVQVTMASIARLAATTPDGTGLATLEGTGAKNLGPRMHTTDSQGI